MKSNNDEFENITLEDLPAAPLLNIFRFLSQKDRVSASETYNDWYMWKKHSDIKWEWCVLPEFRSDAKKHYDENPASHITAKYFIQLISRLSPSTKSFQTDLFDRINIYQECREPGNSFFIHETGLNMEEALDDVKNMNEIAMILLYNNDFDINQCLDSKHTDITPLSKALALNCPFKLVERLIEHDANITMDCINNAIESPEIFEYLIQLRPICFEDEITFEKINEMIIFMIDEFSPQDDREKNIDACYKILNTHRQDYLEYLKMKNNYVNLENFEKMLSKNPEYYEDEEQFDKTLKRLEKLILKCKQEKTSDEQIVLCKESLQSYRDAHLDSKNICG